MSLVGVALWLHSNYYNYKMELDCTVARLVPRAAKFEGFYSWTRTITFILLPMDENHPFVTTTCSCEVVPDYCMYGC